MNSKNAFLSVMLVAGAGFTAPASALNLTNCGTADVPVNCPYVTYGDGNSYALMVNALLHSWATAADPLVKDVGTGPGNPYYVPSGPGQIKDLTVIGTGTNNNPAVTNYPGADDAYPTPNSSGIPYFSTGSTADPGGGNEFTGDGLGTWDVSLNALKAFMGSDQSLIFFFNNNQTDSGASTNQNLAAWAQITIRDSAGALLGTYDFTNQGGKFASIQDGGGGTVFGNPGAYTHAGPLDSPLAGTNDRTDYVLSGGELCYTGNSLLNFTPVSCSTPGANSINSNLGANQAAYAIVFPELNAKLMQLFAGDVTNYSMNVNLRFGCDPATIDPEVNCVGRSLNNGYEQVFIATASSVPVPVPPSLLLLGTGLVGLGLIGTRRARRA